MVAHGVRGRGFNPFYFGGYQLYRFWPERERLPFMDIHQSGTRADRDRYARLPGNGEDWRSLDALHRFDYVLWKRTGYGSESMLDMFDADTNFALVFMDDAAALFVRRSGATASLADSLAYRLIPAGTAGWAQLGPAAARDPSLRARIARELEREAGGSLEHALAESRLGNAAFAFGDLPGARTHLERALTADPRTPKAHELLGEVALAESRPRDAVREFEAERAIGGATLALEMRLGSAWRRLGDVARARTHWQHVLKQDSGFTAAADSLASLQAAGR
jgi:tetratricopeptide (TPR) repeat protein